MRTPGLIIPCGFIERHEGKQCYDINATHTSSHTTQDPLPPVTQLRPSLLPKILFAKVIVLLL